MRIAVCGPDRQVVISKIEKAFKTEVKKPWSVNGESIIIDYAAETYKYFNEENVVFEGSAFDFLGKVNSDGYDDVYEQIALNTLSNLDYIVVITKNMDETTINMYNEYSKMFKDKFYLYEDGKNLEITMG